MSEFNNHAFDYGQPLPWLAAAMIEDEVANQAISDSAQAQNLPLKDFRALARLHLPILYADHELPEPARVSALVARLAEKEAVSLARVRRLFERPTETVENVRGLSFRPLPERDVQDVFGLLHYIRSVRTDAVSWGLYAGTDLIAAASVSPFDLDHLGPLPFSIAPTEAVVLSRVYSFPAAPKNTLSNLFGRIAQLVGNDGKRLLLTYVNPNLGFTGASYRAANWILYCREAGTRYQYLQDRYVTDRYLVRRFGTSDPSEVARRYGGSHRCISQGLAPLAVFAYFTKTQERAGCLNQDAFEVERPEQ